MEHKCLISHFENKFKNQLELEFKSGSLYSEAELQCILYSELRKFYNFVYPETWYGDNRADLVILNESITKIRKTDGKEIKNLSFNIAYYDKKICNYIIELKYGYTIGKLVRALENDIKALKNNGENKNKSIINEGWNNIKNNRLLLYILDESSKFNNKNEQIDIKELKNIEAEGINIIGYVWDGEELKLINNET